MIRVHLAAKISDAPLTSIRYFPLSSLITTAMHLRPESNGIICAIVALDLASPTDPIPRYVRANPSIAVSVLDPTNVTPPSCSPSKAVELSTMD